MSTPPDAMPAADLAPQGENNAAPLDGRMPLRYDEIWQSSLFRPLLITLLVGCIDVALVGFLRHILPGMPITHGHLLTLLGVVSAAVGSYTTTLLIRPDQRDRRTFAYRAAELGLLLFTARALLWTVIDGWPTLNEIIYQPLGSLLSSSYVVALLLILISWGMAAAVTGQFLEMALKPDELTERLPDRYRAVYDSRVRSDRRSMLNRFTEFWIFGGMFMLLLTAGSQFGPSSNGLFAIARQAIPGAVIGSGIVYFLVGLVLIAIGRLAILRAQWQIEEISATTNISRNWPVYVVGLIAVMGITAALLPLGGTFWLARILMAIFNVIYFLVYSVIGLLIGLFMAFMPGGGEETAPPPAEPFAPPPVEAAQPQMEVAPWLGGAFFWIIMALLLGYAAYIYLSGKGVQFDWLQAWWQRLRVSWMMLWQAFGQWRTSTLPGDEETDAEKRPGFDWRHPLRSLFRGDMDPSQRVRYIYHSMLQEAQESGIARHPGETPTRYAPRLESAIQDPDEPVKTITEQFVQVQYAARPAEAESIPVLEQIWQRIRKAIVQLRNDDPGNEKTEIS